MQIFWKKIVIVLAVISFMQNSWAAKASSGKADPLKAVVETTPVTVETSKASKKIEKDNGEIKTLPNGQKVRVFKSKVTQLPKEKGVVYMSQADYDKIVKELSSTTVAKVKEEDPEPTMMVEHPQTAMAVEGAEQALTINEKSQVQMITESAPPVIEPQPIIISAQEKTPVVVQEEAPKQVVVDENKAIKEAPVKESTISIQASVAEKPVEKQQASATPILLIDKEQVRKILTEEIDSDKIVAEHSAEIEKEKQLVAEQIKEKQEKQAYDTAVQETKLSIKESLDRDERIKLNSGLAESEERPQAPATDKELRAVNISPRGKKEITPVVVLPALPEKKELTDEELTAMAKARIEEKQRIQSSNSTAAVKDNSSTFGNLEEVDGIEEANGPIFGFSE